MENYVNRFIYTKWLHKDGFQQRWLRRINRQTEAQFVSDCQRTLTGKKDCYDKQKFYHCATRFKIGKNSGDLIELGRKNPDGNLTVALVDDMSQIDCDITLEEFKAELDRINQGVKEEHKDAMNVYYHSVHLAEPKSDLYNSIKLHLLELFGSDTELIKLSDNSGAISTTHGKGVITYNAVHYHITIHGGEADTITFEEDRKNTTIVFWKFGKTIIFDYAKGIGSW